MRSGVGGSRDPVVIAVEAPSQKEISVVIITRAAGTSSSRPPCGAPLSSPSPSFSLRTWGAPRPCLCPVHRCAPTQRSTHQLSFVLSRALQRLCCGAIRPLRHPRGRLCGATRRCAVHDRIFFSSAHLTGG